jgi:hypothetical protein
MQKLSSPIKLIEDSFKIFFVKENLLYFGSIYLILIPFQIFQYFQGSMLGINVENFKFTPMVGVAGGVNLLYFFVYLLTSIAGIVAVKQVITKKPFNFKDTMIFAWKNLWGFSIVSGLVFLATMGGLILLIIPGIIFGIWFSFAKFIFVDKGLGAKASMGMSRGLVKGRFWAILVRFVVFGLFGGIMGVAASSIPYGIGSFVVTLLGALFILPPYLLYRELSD